jgi:hypothetical protein
MENYGMGQMTERILTLTNYVESKGKYLRKRVTIAPHAIHFLVAGDETYEIVEEKELRQVNVILADGSNLELYISFLDLLTLERVVGNYVLP